MKSEGWRVSSLKHIINLRWVVLAALFTLHYSLFISPAGAQIIQKGKASYYTKKATGWLTANGERHHHDSLTCAHRTLPFGTLLKVTNLENGKSVIVRVNDRGPYVQGRIVDLSQKAARELGMITKGIVNVTLEEAYRIVIPLKAPGVKIELPKIEVPNVELPDTLRTIWQEDQLIVHPKKGKVKREKRRVKRGK